MAHRADVTDEKRKAFYDWYKRNSYIFECIFTSLIVIDLLIVLVFSVITAVCYDKESIDDTIEYIQRIFIIIMFFSFSVAFLTFGIMLMRQLKLYFEEFYNKYYKLLLFANIGLSIPLFLRSLYDTLVLIMGTDWAPFTNEFTTNCMVFILCDAIPMCL